MLKLARAVVAVGFLVALAVLVPSTPALAGTCGTTSVCTFELTVSNVTQLTPIDVRVTWDNSGATTVFKVQWISGGPGTPSFIEEFGYNSAVAVTSVSDGTANAGKWAGTSNTQVDGFGKFLTDEQRPVLGESFGIASPIVFTLASKILSIDPNSVGTEFVAHVGGFPTGCSGFVGEAGSTPGTSSNPACAAVPEPATLFLVGTGLAGFGFLGRKRWMKGIRTA